MDNPVIYLIKSADTKAITDALRKIVTSTGAKHIAQGAAGGALATMAVMPLDTISDVQKQWRNTKDQPELTEASKSFYKTTKEIYHPKIREGAEGGIKPFYAGFGGKLIKTVPAQAITWGVAAHLGDLLGTKK